MHRLPAKVLEPADVRLLLKHVASQRYPERNRVMVLLSFKAGMRACEIAGLSWPMILGSDHSLSSQMVVGNDIAKGGSGRAIPMHAETPNMNYQRTPRSALKPPIRRIVSAPEQV